MKKILLASALAAGASFLLVGTSFSHGGTYRGPGDTVPPGGGGGGGGSGPSTPGPSGPNSPGPSGPSSPGPAGPGTPGAGPGAAPAAPSTGGGGMGGPDLTAWTFWWEFNKEPYLNLRAHIHSGGVTTGSDGWFLGQGQKKQAKDSLRPSDEQIRQVVVPALMDALDSETNNDIVTGCLIALAKIGDENDEGGNSAVAEAIIPKLQDSVQEIQETAAVALGILANDRYKDHLVHLLLDDADGRKLVGGGEVSLRTRSFAAFGLSLIGARTADEDIRKQVVQSLSEVLVSDKSSMHDIRVACVVALGLVPLETVQPPTVAEGETVPAWSSRKSQIDFLREYFLDDDNQFQSRAHVPAALARLIQGLPAEDFEAYKELIADDFLERIDKRSKEVREIQQSCVLALGQIGDRDDDPKDVEIRKALTAATKELSDQQSRNYSLIAAAQVAGTPGEGDLPKKDDVTKHLMTQLAKGKSSIQPWAGLAIGVMGRKLTDNGEPAPADMTAALRSSLKDESNPERVGAYSIAAGILGDLDASDELRKKLNRMSDDEARGYISVALGLMNSRESIEDIQKIVKDSKYRPDLLKQAAIALGLLGDKELVPELMDMLAEAKGLATQAALSSALGFIGDSRSIDPLVGMLQDKDLTDTARGFAAVALGIVAEKEPLPWNAKISVDLNYRATTPTLNDTNGTGILNIL